MKVLIIGSDNRWRMEKGVQRALKRAGHKTRLIDDRRTKRLLGRKLTQRLALTMARRFNPDFVFLSKCLGLDLATVQEIIAGRDNAMWYLDPPSYRNIKKPDVAHAAAVGRMSNTFFTSGFIPEWRGLGLPAKFLPAAADRELGPTKPDKRSASDVAFIGGGYDTSRARFLVKISRKFDLRVWGPGWEEWRKELRWNGGGVYGPAYAKVCSSARIILGINPAIAKGATNYTSNRPWTVLQAGGFYLGHGTDGVTALLQGGDHCAWYTDLDSCIERITHYLANPATRERIRRQGQHFVSEYHTFDQRIHNLLSHEEFVNPLE
ncbi:MAG TPA: glycosyltransferase [Gemmatimonadaceae bacterium]|nr:glycosyltransferase [Gemmatimonadaceae bacterium]